MGSDPNRDRPQPLLDADLRCRVGSDGIRERSQFQITRPMMEAGVGDALVVRRVELVDLPRLAVAHPHESFGHERFDLAGVTDREEFLLVTRRLREHTEVEASAYAI